MDLFIGISAYIAGLVTAMAISSLERPAKSERGIPPTVGPPGPAGDSGASDD